MAHIGIIGGHGKVALLAEPLLVQAGHTVTGIIRDEAQAADVLAAGAKPHVSDIASLSTDEMAQLFTDHSFDVIVWSAGAGGGDEARTYAVDRDAAIRSIDAAKQAGVERYVMVSYLGASLHHTVPEGHSFFAYAQSKAEADEHLRQSGLRWTLLGPTALSFDEPTGAIAVTTTRGDAKVSRANVAQVIDAVIADDTTIGKAIPFTDGDTPIADAVKAAPASDQLA